MESNKRETKDWREGWWITHVDGGLAGAMVDQDLEALMMAIARCPMERCILVVTKSVDVGMSIKKELDALMMTID